MFFDLRRHADGAAELDERVFTLEDKAARETFANRGEARRWLAENARQLASCLGPVTATARLLREVTKRRREWLAAGGLSPPNP